MPGSRRITNQARILQMAKATRIDEVTEVTTVVVSPEAFVLHLSREEADVLRAILNRIGGDPKTTRRGIADRVNDALRDVGLRCRTARDICEKNGRIYFVETQDAT